MSKQEVVKQNLTAKLPDNAWELIDFMNATGLGSVVSMDYIQQMIEQGMVSLIPHLENGSVEHYYQFNDCKYIAPVVEQQPKEEVIVEDTPKQAPIKKKKK